MFLKSITLLSIILLLLAIHCKKNFKNSSNEILTFVANSETKGYELNASTMDIFRGVQYPHLSLLVPLLLKKNAIIEVVDWEDKTIEWHKKEKVILGPVWGYTKKLDAFIEWLDLLEAKNINVINHPKFLKWNLTKTYLLDLARKDIPIPHTLIVNPESNLTLNEVLDIFYKKYEEKDIILKGVIDSGAFGYLHVQSNEMDRASYHFEKLKKENKGAIIQSFIPEIQKKGEFSFVFLGNYLSHFFVKVPKSNDERTQSFYGGKSFHLINQNLDDQISFIQSNFKSEFFLEKKDIIEAQNQVKNVHTKLLCLMDELSIPYPKYVRIDGVIINNEFIVMEIEGIEPYLEMQEAMEKDKLNPILQNYIEKVIGILN